MCVTLHCHPLSPCTERNASAPELAGLPPRPSPVITGHHRVVVHVHTRQVIAGRAGPGYARADASRCETARRHRCGPTFRRYSGTRCGNRLAPLPTAVARGVPARCKPEDPGSPDHLIRLSSVMAQKRAEKRCVPVAWCALRTLRNGVCASDICFLNARVQLLWYQGGCLVGPCTRFFSTLTIHLLHISTTPTVISILHHRT